MATILSDEPLDRQHNQYEKAVPDHVLRPLVEKYYGFGFGDTRIVEAIKKELDLQANHWTLSAKTIQRRRKEWNLPSVKQQGHTVDSIGPLIERIRLHSDNRLGAKSIRDHLRHEKVLVSRKLIQVYQHKADPIGNQQRKGRRLKRAVHWSAGPHERWSADQHDKWRRFGLFLHMGLENFSNSVLWLRVWWTNSNPRLIASFYLEAARTTGGIPLVTQSDPGTENHGMANAQTTLRQMLDPSLAGTLQHQWMRGHSNIKPEIFWSKLRRQWSPGWESMFEEGLTQGWYDPSDSLDLLLFRWLAVPMIQEDLDRFRHIHNTSKPRRDNKKAMPCEIPLVLLDQPEDYGPYRDYKVAVSDEQLETVRELYAPPQHDVFRLVPDMFHQQALQAYTGLGQPQVNRESFWIVFGDMAQTLRGIPPAHAIQLSDVIEESLARENIVQHEYLAVLPGPAVRGPAKMGPVTSYVAGRTSPASEMNDNKSEFSEGGDEADIPIVDMTLCTS